MIKTYFSLLILIFSLQNSFSQIRKIAEFGKPTLNEFRLTSYEKDPGAAGVVLFESGENKIKLQDNRILLIKEVHRKIKVIDAKNFNNAMVEIPYYKGKNSKENITFLKAITHNDKLQTFISKENFFDIDVNES